MIENQRNEDLCVGGTWTAPKPTKTSAKLAAACSAACRRHQCRQSSPVIACCTRRPPLAWGAPATSSLTGLSSYAPDDPEPEFVDINDGQRGGRHAAGEQPPRRRRSADVTGEARLSRRAASRSKGVDTTEDGEISLTETLADVPREPDAVAWVPGPAATRTIATANEGDLFGGSRGFSIFRRNGAGDIRQRHVARRARRAARALPGEPVRRQGHRARGDRYGRFGRDDYLFVGSERGSFVAVYTIDRAGRPEFEQLLPGPLGPEGLLADSEPEPARRLRRGRPRRPRRRARA